MLGVDGLLSAVDAIEQISPKILNHGLKEKYPNNSENEKAAIKSYQDDLRRLISLERVCPRSERSLARLSNGKIEIVKRNGKWSSMSSSEYLEPHEALYLMEINRLEVLSNDVILSLERAYSLFLRDYSSNGRDKLSLEEYAVYSTFSRNGFCVQRHKGDRHMTNSATETSNYSSTMLSETQNCIWTNLFSLLGLKNNRQDKNCDDEVLQRMKTSMNATIDQFRSVHGNDGKRKSEGDSESSTAKRLKCDESLSTNFADTFNRLNVIKLESGENVGDNDDDEHYSQLNYTFDVWTDGSYKKSKRSTPNYRFVVSRATEQSDAVHRQIQRLFHTSKLKVPIVLIYVNEELSFNSYSYQFE